MKKDFMAVILGSDENAYGFARVFYETYGIKSIALTIHVLEVSMHSDIIEFIRDENLHDPSHFVAKLNGIAKKLKQEYEKVILIPCSDLYMELCVKERFRLVGYENSFIDYSIYKRFNLKEKFYEMCEIYNLPYPKTLACTKDNYRSVIRKNDFNYPLILKPNNSNSEDYLTAEFEGKEKVYFVNSEEELLKKLEIVYHSTYKGEMLIQKFVGGDDTHMRVLNVYCDKSGKVRIMSLGQPILEEYHPSTFGNYAAIISIPGMTPIMKNIKTFLESIKFKGACNFDIKIDEESGECYLFEINPRPGRSSFFTTPAGASIQKAYVEDLVYNRLENNFGNTDEILFLNVPFILLKRYVRNKELLEKAVKLKEKKAIFHVLKYDRDKSIKRKLCVYKQYARKIHYFPKYFIEKK